jgi:hypothetical protein
MVLPFLSLVLMERDETRTRCAVAVPIRTLSVALLPAQSTPECPQSHKFDPINYRKPARRPAATPGPACLTVARPMWWT